MAKKSREFGDMRLGLLEDFELKKLEVEQRLAKVFAVFINTPGGGYFITGGNVTPALFGNENFRCVFVGHSLVDLVQGEDMLREIGSFISTTFSSGDLQATVVLDFISKYLRADLEDMKVPTGFAVEFMMIDTRGNLMRIRFSGEMEIDELKEGERELFIVGAYDGNFKKRLMADLKKAPNSINQEQIKTFGERLKRKYRLSHLGYVL